MIRGALAGLLIASGCGRIAFDPLGDAGSAGDDAGEESVFVPVALPPGGEAEGIVLGAGSVYAWFEGRGAFRSDDQGASYIECERVPAEAMVVRGDGTVFLAPTDGDVLSSSDRCATWQSTGLALPTEDLEIVGSALYAATSSGLRVYGTGWQTVPTPFEGTTVHAIAGANMLLLIGSDAGIARSLDGGMTWSLQNAGLNNRIVEAITIAPSLPTRVYAIESSGSGTTGAAYRSNDSGGTWTSQYGNGGYSLEVDPADPDRVLYANYNALLESTNGGSTYTDIRTAEMGLVGSNEVAFDGIGGSYVATNRGVFYRAGSSPFVARHGALDAWSLELATATPSRDEIYWATGGGVLRSLDGGGTFTPVSTAGASDVDTPVGAPSSVFMSNRYIDRSGNYGQTFARVFDAGAVNDFTVRKLASSGTRIFGATRTRIVYADAPYSTWSQVVVGGAARLFQDVDVLPNGTVIAVSEVDGVYESTNNGQTFQPIVGSPTDARRMFAAPDGTLLIGTTDGLWSYTGGAWMRRGLDSQGVRDLIALDVAWIATTYRGVYVSRDQGSTWTRLPGLVDHDVRSVTLDVDGNLLVGTAGFGMFRAAFP